jgi:hypothetical protein
MYSQRYKLELDAVDAGVHFDSTEETEEEYHVIMSPRRSPLKRSPRSPRVFNGSSSSIPSVNDRPLENETTIPLPTLTKAPLSSPRTGTVSKVRLKERPIIDIAMDTMRLPSISMDNAFKKRIVKKIRAAMQCGSVKAVVAIIIQGEDFTTSPTVNNDRFHNLSPDTILIDSTHIKLNGVARSVAKFLLACGIEWHIHFPSTHNAIIGEFVASQHAMLLATWYNLGKYKLHAACNDTGVLRGEWESIHVIRGDTPVDLEAKWRVTVYHAIASGKTSAILMRMVHQRDYFSRSPKSGMVSIKYDGQVVPCGGRMLPSQISLPPSLNAVWQLTMRHKDTVRWMKENGLQWSLLFEVSDTNTGRVLSPSAYLCVYFTSPLALI